MDQNTPLHIAAAYGHIPAINTLIELGAQKDAVNALGATALHQAAGQGKTAAVIALIKDHGFDPHAVDRGGRTPLLYAADENGNIETFNALITCGARVNQRDYSGTSILHYAARHNKAAIIISLIRDHHFNPNSETNHRETPLGLAIETASCLAEFALLYMGAAINDEEKDIYRSHSRSCLRFLTTSADRETILRAFEQGSLAPWNTNSLDGLKFPLIRAAIKGCLSCTKLLLKDPRTDPNLQDDEKETALHHLIRNWHSRNAYSKPAICSLFLNLRRTKVGIKDGAGSTPRQILDETIQKGYSRFSEKLAELSRLFDLRKMRVQLYLSLKNARCSEQCEQAPCLHSAHLPADIRFKIAALLTEESLPKPT